MAFKQLFILIEGDDDERFFRHIITPILQERYTYVQFYQYAQRSASVIGSFIRSIQAMKADYIIAGDIDEIPCITQKKETLKNEKLKKADIQNNHIAIIIKEIESWYMAGLDEKALHKLGISYKKDDTNNLTKEVFDSFVHGKYKSRINLMQEILRLFQIDTAQKRNRSFEYFTLKYSMN